MGAPGGGQDRGENELAGLARLLSLVRSGEDTIRRVEEGFS